MALQGGYSWGLMAIRFSQNDKTKMSRKHELFFLTATMLRGKEILGPEQPFPIDLEKTDSKSAT
jgi:hypothetical protein